MAKHRCGAGGQNGGQPTALTSNYLMPNRIDTRVQSMQAPCPNPPVDRSFAETESRELPPPHHPMLSPRQLGDIAIITASPRKPFLKMG